jgi:GT2 family glycosyltransferase/glycosyltransferase involved in cell wall biosynthesis
MAETGSNLAALIRRFEETAAAGRWSDAQAIARYHLGASSGDAPRHAWAVTALARCAAAQGDTKAAQRWIDRATRLVDADAEFRDFHASLLLEIGAPEAALALLEPEDDGDVSLRLTTGIALALAHWQSDRPDSAVALLADLLQGHLLIEGGSLEQLAGTISAALGLPGWVGHRGGGVLAGALHERAPANAEIVVGGPAGPFRRCSVAEFRASFATGGNFRLPLAATGADLQDGPWTLSVEGRPLLGSGLGLRQSLAIDGEVAIDGDLLQGWVAAPDHAALAPQLLLKDEIGASLTLPTQPLVGDDGHTRHRFEVVLTDATGLQRGRLLVLAGPFEAALAGSPVVWGVQQRPPVRRRRRRGAAPIVDIIIPVYGGRAETLACLHAVLAATDNPAAELVVVDDATPDGALAEALDDLAKDGRITLIRHTVNLGFPASVNRGMALHGDRDVVLLNADTLVSGDWLRRLQRAAYEAPLSGTVTPLSNDATICSYPARDDADPAPPPDAATCAALDRLAAAVNDGQRVDLPTAVGFCMYIRRDCLDDTGPFSEALFGRGYGEENDFCRRASAKGWRHLAAADVYVGHVGGRSFGRQRQLLIERNLLVMERRHPGYGKVIADFIAADPLAPLRRRLDLARWQADSALATMLLITLGLEGGTAQHVEERRRQLQDDGWRVLTLLPAGERRSRLVDAEQPDLRDLRFDGDSEFDDLLALLQRSAVVEAEIHHSLQHAAKILDLPASLGIPYDIVIHDYHWLCPQVTLIDSSGRYCGEPDLDACERCRLTLGAESGEDISVAALRARSAALLRAARRVIVAADDVAARYRRYFPTLLPIVQPWDSVLPPPDEWRPPHRDGDLRVCVIGAIGRHKGYDLLYACALDAAERGLTLTFVLVGYSCDDAALFATGRVFVTGRFRPDEAVELTRRQDADWAFVPSVCPETWCYAVSTAWQAGLKVAAFDLGVPAERIRATGGGAILPLDFDAATINDSLIALSTDGMVAGIPNPLRLSVQKDPFMIPATTAFPASPIIATPQELALSPGFYAVTVLRGGRPQQPGPMTVPAIQVTTPPASASLVETLSSHAGGWLTQPGDTVLLKVSGPATILLTSYRSSQAPADTLEIQFSRVDGQQAAVAPKFAIVAHIQGLGDQTFTGDDWAGAIGQNLWIEGFGIVPEEGLAPEEIEYKGVAANGWETPWFAGGALCGTRGQAMPLIGVGIRLRGAAAERFDCVYEASFVRGSRSGPARGGTVCRSDVIGAPLEGFRLSLAPKV